MASKLVHYCEHCGKELKTEITPTYLNCSYDETADINWKTIKSREYALCRALNVEDLCDSCIAAIYANLKPFSEKIKELRKNERFF